MKKALTYSAGLIALYLIVEHALGAGTIFEKGGKASTGLIRALQGR